MAIYVSVAIKAVSDRNWDSQLAAQIAAPVPVHEHNEGFSTDMVS